MFDSTPAPQDGIYTIDCDYLKPGYACSYLIIDGDEAAFIDNNTYYAVPKLIAKLSELGMHPDQVRYVIVTHVHLDHSGGTSRLLDLCNKAKVLAHPRAARHLIQPERLIKSAKQVYGEEDFAKLYGEIKPIPEDRVQSVEDDERVPFGQSDLVFLHTRGHANHHVCITWAKHDALFTGDSFGLCYPALQDQTFFILPSTSPTDYDGTLAKKTLARLMNLGFTHFYLTHFGCVTQLEEARRQLENWIDVSDFWLKSAEDKTEDTPEELQKSAHSMLLANLEKETEIRGIRKGSASFEKWIDILSLDLKINAQGLAFVAQKNRQKKNLPPPLEIYLLPVVVKSQNPAVLMAAGTFLFATLYLVPNHYPLKTPLELPLWWIDKAVPFLPETVWIYLSAYVMIYMAFLGLRKNSEKNELFYAFLTTTLVSSAVFVALPTVYPRNFFPTEVPHFNSVSDYSFSKISTSVLHVLRYADNPTNCAPSMHVCIAFLSAFIFVGRNREKFFQYLVWAFAIWLSTMTTKQHYWIDGFLGAGLAGVATFWVRGRVQRQD